MNNQIQTTAATETTRTQRPALDAYVAHHTAALALVKRIHDGIENHGGAANVRLNWGHVGDIVETERLLQEIADFMFGDGSAA